ncbi:MAG: hypothetical protein H7318_20830 [Oligoflexus sp.]|nr:hypothetical protein [Oligoflexus sp.]
MAENAARKHDAGAAAFFVETLCQDADTLLRFAYALTLSDEWATDLVYKTYKSILPKLPELLKKDGTYIRQLLLRRIWEVHHEEAREGTASDNVLYPFLKLLDLETRAALFLCDVVGLSIDEALEITPMDHNDLRRHLAAGRKRLLDFRFE